MTPPLTRRAAALIALACALPAWAADPPRVKFETTMGDFVVEVYPDKAPRTVENFLQYVRDRHYDGTLFHRVIDNFMIQGGGFQPGMKQKPTRPPVPHEARAAFAAGLKNETGTIAMARTSDPDSATAQFYINVKDNAFLDPVPIPPGDPVPRFEYRGQVMENVPRARLENHPALAGYTVFGRVVSGMEVVNRIKSVPTSRSGGHEDVPVTPVVIRSATLVN